jgi:hypothetical protein
MRFTEAATLPTKTPAGSPALPRVGKAPVTQNIRKPQQAASPSTGSWHETPPDAGNEAADAYGALQQIRSNHLENLPLEKKLDMVLKQSSNAEKVAFRALNGVEGFSRQLDRVFKELSGKIERVAGGKPPVEPDNSASIFDDESIFT